LTAGIGRNKLLNTTGMHTAWSIDHGAQKLTRAANFVHHTRLTRKSMKKNLKNPQTEEI